MVDDCPVLPVNHVVSREHFLIDVTQGKCILTDLGSVCGTTVNGKIIGQALHGVLLLTGLSMMWVGHWHEYHQGQSPRD